MKFIDIIVIISTIFILIEGFEMEFSNPTIFDYIKWFCCILMILSYIYYKKKGSA